LLNLQPEHLALSDNAHHRGAFVDSPQTLATLSLQANEPYTLVVAQHGLPLPKYAFTLSLFSRASLSASLATEPFLHSISKHGSWTSRTAGGNASSPTYPLNPQFSISIPSVTDLTLVLETDRDELAVHVKMVHGRGQRIAAVTGKDIVGSSGDYRRGCALSTLQNVDAGTYTIVCSTFEAGQLGNFTLRVGSSVPCVVKPVLAEGAGKLSLELPVLRFEDEVERMLAPLSINRLTKLMLIARSNTPQSRSRPLIKLSLELSQGPHKTVLCTTNNGQFSDAPAGIRTSDIDIGPLMGSRGVWIVVERLGGQSGSVNGVVTTSGERRGRLMEEVHVEILSDVRVEVGVWGIGEG